MLEGQLCYKLMLNKTSEKGKGGELMLLLDYNEDRSMQQSSSKPEDWKSETKDMDISILVNNVGCAKFASLDTHSVWDSMR